MVDSGVREIGLIAQDTMRYGADLYGRPCLVRLLESLLGIDGLEWIRLLYTYPLGWNDDLIELLASEKRLCAYVDMPIQHASDPILKAMNRGTTREGIRALIQRLRDRIPDLTLRSSVVVGFPGEREEHIGELIDFIEEVRFTRLGGFTYSHEEGTAAGALDDDVPEPEKRERLDRIMSVQTAISSEIAEACVGQTHRVLIDRPSDDPAFDFVGRTRMDAPEIDGEVFVTGNATVGEFCTVAIAESTPFDLIGQVVEPGALIEIAPPAGSRAVR
jgi:ribosomal protein S12 methylthiotransferase